MRELVFVGFLTRPKQTLPQLEAKQFQIQKEEG